ncbi:MAG TPA: carboxypeptidase regulatory-like domain-containing protein [Bryobacteraceae bacterium]
MKSINFFYRLAVLSLVAALCAWGQAVSSLAGVVSDASGGVIPGATVKVENASQGLNRETKSDQAGRYTLPQLPPGTYKVTAKADGFADTVVSEVILRVNSPVTLPLKMELGKVSESVAVSAEATQVNTTDASIGNAIGTTTILELPLNARNIVGLLALQPGVVFTTEGDTNDRNGAVNGGKSDQANVTLDGVDVNDQMDRNAFTSVLRVTPDSIQEFRVTTLNANADSGRTSGAQVVLITKGGTNQMHGSLYEYHRNTLTTANGFFNNLAGVERPKLIRNIFGASAGGPIKTNRLFYFVNYEGRRDAKDGTVVREVPSMDMRQGILHYQRKDGSIATVLPSDLAAKIDDRGVNQAALKIFQSYPTPNDNTIGDNLNLVGYRFKAPTPLRWNTYITRLDYHLDSSDRHTIFLRGNLQNDHEDGLPQLPGQTSASTTLRNNKGFAFGLSDLLSPTMVSTFRYGLTRQGWDTTGLQTFAMVTFRGVDPNIPTSRNFTAIIPTHTVSEDLSWTNSAHTVQAGAVARFIRNQRRDFQNSFSSASANASWLTGSGSDLTAPFSDMATSGITLFRYAVTDVMGMITQGNAQYNYLVNGTPVGEGNAVHRDFASNEYEMYVQDTWKLSQTVTITGGVRWSLTPPIYEANGQQVSPSIPLGDWFNQRGALAQQGLSQMGAGRISFIPADGPGGSPLYDFHKKNFAPRLSMAFSPKATSGLSKFFFGGPGRTSIRAGFGMFYDLFGSGLMRSQDATAFGLSTALTNPSAVLTTATAPRFTALNAIPNSIMLPDPGAKFPATYPDAFAITRGVDPTIKPPYTMNANFSIGREFKNEWFVQASYVGRFARRSIVRRDGAMPTNLKDPKSGMAYFEAATILARQVVAGVPTANVQKVPFWENLYSKAATATQTATQVVYSRFAANTYDWTYALYQLDTGAGQGGCDSRARCSDLGPYTFFSPQFSYLSMLSSIGSGNYNGGQLSIRKRFGDGGSVDLNYTYSKSMDLRSTTERAGSTTGVIWNPWFPGLSRGVSDYDNTHLFNVQGVYNVPLGKGKMFLRNAHGIVQGILGGWQVSGAWRWSSGFPVSVYETGVWPTNWNNNVWASWNLNQFTTAQTKNAPAVAGTGGPNLFPNPSSALGAFQYVMPGEIGNRNPIRGDGIFNIDTNLSKRFIMPYKDGRHSIQIRWETFNLTNTAKFDAYTASLDISIAGTFGKYTDQLTQPRVMQFGLRYEF